MWIQVVAMLFILSTALRLEISVLLQITECTEIKLKIEKRINDSSAAIGYAWTSEKEKELKKERQNLYGFKTITVFRSMCADWFIQ